MLAVLLAFNWTFQLLFGKYRPWGAVGPQHLIVLLACGGLFVVVYVGLLNRRIGGYVAEKESIPRALMPVEQDKQGALLVLKAHRKNAKLIEKVAHEIIPDNACAGDPGWAKATDVLRGGHWRTTNFRVVVLNSCTAVEAAALSRRPNLRLRHSRTVREYLSLLEREFPQLRHELVTEYVRTYERARYGSHKFVYADYELFMQSLHEIVNTITSGNTA